MKKLALLTLTLVLVTSAYAVVPDIMDRLYEAIGNRNVKQVRVILSSHTQQDCAPKQQEILLEAAQSALVHAQSKLAIYKSGTDFLCSLTGTAGIGLFAKLLSDIRDTINEREKNHDHETPLFNTEADKIIVPIITAIGCVGAYGLYKGLTLSYAKKQLRYAQAIKGEFVQKFGEIQKTN